jgi:hypothetical protein
MDGYLFLYQIGSMNSLTNNANELYSNPQSSGLEMNIIRCRELRLVVPMLAIALISSLWASSTIAAEATNNVAFPDKTMFRLGSYAINQASTDILVLSSAGTGTIISFDEDLGGEDSGTIPRIDGYYRFNERHRIDFSSFSIDRTGSKTISGVDLTIGDETFLFNETILSEIKYSLFKLGYAYSFYHSPIVELSLTAGLNVTDFDFNFSQDDGSNASANGASGPLPMFGLSMGYAINSNWSIHYISEQFVIELGNEFRGTLLNNELNLEYKFDNKIAIGGGFVRSSTDLEVNDSDWSGSLVDSYRGIVLYAAYYF